MGVPSFVGDNIHIGCGFWVSALFGSLYLVVYNQGRVFGPSQFHSSKTFFLITGTLILLVG